MRRPRPKSYRQFLWKLLAELLPDSDEAFTFPPPDAPWQMRLKAALLLTLLMPVMLLVFWGALAFLWLGLTFVIVSVGMMLLWVPVWTYQGRLHDLKREEQPARLQAKVAPGHAEEARRVLEDDFGAFDVEVRT